MRSLLLCGVLHEYLKNFAQLYLLSRISYLLPKKREILTYVSSLDLLRFEPIFHPNRVLLREPKPVQQNKQHSETVK